MMVWDSLMGCVCRGIVVQAKVARACLVLPQPRQASFCASAVVLLAVRWRVHD